MWYNNLNENAARDVDASDGSSVKGYASMSNSTTFVYFISAGSTPIKIGISSDPLARLRELQTAHYQRLYLLYTIECSERSHALELEAAFHRWYGDKQLLNEWYSLTPKRVAADIHLLATLAKVFVRVEQHIQPEKVERMEVRAEKKLATHNGGIVERKDGLIVAYTCPGCNKRLSIAGWSRHKKSCGAFMKLHHELNGSTHE